MHILLIHQAFAALDEPGGTRHHELARFLIERGHRVTVIASPVSYLTGTAQPTAPAAEESLRGSLVIRRAYTYTAGGGGLHRSFFHRILSFLSFMLSSFVTGLRVRNVDLVWGTSPPIFQGLTAWALARLHCRPLIFEVRDLWPAFAIQVGVLHNPLLIKLSEWLERFLYRQASHVMVNSPGFTTHVSQRGAVHVTLVANGADPRMFDPDLDGTAYKKQNNLTDKFVVMYAGAHGLSNDLDIVLQAAARLRSQPQIAIALVGDGKEKPRLEKEAHDQGLDNVHFLSPVPKTAMNATLAGADACLAILKPIPLYATVYPNKVFDYMAAGKAVVLAIEGVISEVIAQAGCGLAIKPGDPDALANAILQLHANQAECQAQGRRGRAYIEAHFDRAILADQLENLFTKVHDEAAR
jgi:glycosyltransferase involved in cell wall biosynthesis